MKSALLLAILPAALTAQDAREIVRRSLDGEQRNFAASRNYTYIERQEEQQLDGSGNVKERLIRTWDVTLLEGSPYRRLIARNDQPLSQKEQEQEEEKLRYSIEQRRKETPDQKARRMAEWEKNRQKRREPIKELPDAFDFRLLGEDNGAYVVEGTPKPGYRPKLSSASFFPKVKVKFWVDKRDYQWRKLDMETLDTVTFGGVVVRVSKGSHLLAEQTRVNDEVWLPKNIDLRVAARLLLFKGFRRQYLYSYSGYKKFQAESRVVE